MTRNPVVGAGHAVCAGVGMALLAWLLPGCAVFRPTDAYVPAARTERDAPVPVGGTSSPTRYGAAPLTLDDCLALVRQHSPALAAAGQDAQAAEALA